jgi:hypothetical protein
MDRATDLCTCGKPRDEHGDFFDLTQHTFFPNPQPNAVPKKSMIERVEKFLGAQGYVMASADNEFRTNDSTFRVREDDGTIWEVAVILRRGPAASSEGV